MNNLNYNERQELPPDRLFQFMSLIGIGAILLSLFVCGLLYPLFVLYDKYEKRIGEKKNENKL